MNLNVNGNLKSLSKKNNRDFWFYFIPLLLATVFLAGTAAYFSIYGLSKVFAGARVPAIIMASAIEFGKIVAVSYTNRFWNSIGGLRGYLLAAIIISMIVTSASIFGFLSDAYQKTAGKMEIIDKQTQVEQNKKTYLIQQIESCNKQISLKRERMAQLNNLRSNQETRLDSMYNRGLYSSAKRTESQINDASTEIIELNKDISNLSGQIFSINDSINAVDARILTHSATDAAADLGPIIFVKNLFNTDMNKVVFIFIFMLIFVFDPMAMALVIAINKLFIMRSENSDKPIDTNQEPDKPNNNALNKSIEARFEEIHNKTTSGGLIVKPQIENLDDTNRK